VHPEDLDRCHASYCSSFDARRNFHIECRLRRADGAYRWMLCTGVPRFERGVFAGYIGSDVDITDLRRAQEESFERQKMETLRVLIGGIAHDFNNLLGSILAESDLAEADFASGASPAEGIQTIRSVAIRAAEIVRELMIYAGHDQAPQEPVEVSRLVEEMLELLKVSISKHAVLTTDLDRNLPRAQVSAARLRQVVMNLLLNASEAMGEQDGAIHVTTALVTGGRSLAPDDPANLPYGDYVRLEVSDTGCGMTEETKARIFDPFFTTKFAGRGLGMAVVQGIVRAHGGAIHLLSTPGRGTRVQILLPCVDEVARKRRDAPLTDSEDRTPRPAGSLP
jgi:signal transduction histidine kinase